MKDEKETKLKLLESAREEFMEKGYNHASLRNICKKVGVTTGALYFFFQDKEDLFASLVEEPIQQLYQIMSNHYAEEQQLGENFSSEWDTHKDAETARQIVSYLYHYRESFLLVLTKSEGSRYEHCKDQFVDITEQHYQGLFQATCSAGMKEPDPYLIHWMAHMHIDIFVHLLTHESDVEKATQHVAEIVEYLMKGWDGLF